MTKAQAKDLPFWTTTVEIEKSESDIKKLLRNKGAEKVGTMFDDDEGTLIVIFRWDEEPYTIEYRPVKPEYPDEPQWREDMERWRKKCVKLDEQSLRQMGRIALNHIKTLLHMALQGPHEEMLLPYQQLPGGGPTLQHLGKDGFMEAIRAATEGKLALPAPDYVEEVDA